MVLAGLYSPRAMKRPSCETTSTSAPGEGWPSTRSIEESNTHGCRAKNGRARRGFRMTLGALDMGNRDLERYKTAKLLETPLIIRRLVQQDKEHVRGRMKSFDGIGPNPGVTAWTPSSPLSPPIAFDRNQSRRSSCRAPCCCLSIGLVALGSLG